MCNATNLVYSDDHKKLIRSFQEVCYWNYEVRTALKVMGGYSYEKVDYHMYRVITALKEYWILQVHKFFDAKYSFEDESKPNLVLDYVIDEVPWPAQIKGKLQDLKSKMLPFVQALKKARHKVIVHPDLKALTNRSNEWFGFHQEADELKFYESLLDFLNTVQGAIDGSPRLEWPEFAHSDAVAFMGILENAGCAHLENV